jgi:hypothetical protein
MLVEEMRQPTFLESLIMVIERLEISDFRSHT